MKTKKILVCGLIAVILALAFTACPEPDPGGLDETETDTVFRMVWQGELENAPANPVAGWVYFNMTDQKLYVYYNNGWSQLGTPGPAGADGTQLAWKGTFAGSDAAELANPQAGWLYYDTAAKASFIYLNGWQKFAQDGSPGTGGGGGTPELEFIITDGVLFVSVDGGAPVSIGNVRGEKGDKGDPGDTVSIGADGYWYINDVNTGIKAQGPKGDPGDGSEAVNVPGATLAEKISWLRFNAQSNGSYILELSADESVDRSIFDYNGRHNITITLRGAGTNRTLSLTNNTLMFIVGSGVTLVLDNNITLQGRSGNNGSLVFVRDDGALVMNAGSVITGNTNTAVYTDNYGGGAVWVAGIFTMNGGKISGNTILFNISNNNSGKGGGVYVDNGGTFIMNNGEISGNTANTGGGGVYVRYGGSFIKTGGTITGYKSDTVNGNAVKDSNGSVIDDWGHAAHVTYWDSAVQSEVIKNREATAGPEVNLLFDGNAYRPVSSGGWGDVTYTVTFSANSGSGAPSAQTVGARSVIQLPEKGSLSNGDKVFGGWNTEPDGTGTQYPAGTSYSVTGSVTLYAKWWGTLETVSGLANKLEWLDNLAQSDTAYTLEISADESIIGTQNLYYGGRSGITITLRGIGTSRTVSLAGYGPMFGVNSGVTLVLDNITLQGRSDNGDSLVMVYNGGALSMNAGSVITGNRAGYGGGVYVSGGTFTMTGGEISGNTAASYGGGVYVSSDGTFTMTGGEISGNTSPWLGGGVFVTSGTFTMNDGKIFGNTASDYGGGVFVDAGTFNMAGGEISGNTAYGGSGVYVSGDSTFTMTNGEISGNTANTCGGVYVCGTFTMSGGTISGNNGYSYYGGVCVYGNDAIFTMNGGTISNNISDTYGGGVSVTSGSSFIMNNGTISGNTAGEYALGGGVYVYAGNATFTMNGGTISGNSAANGGGGVHVSDNSAFNMAGGTISGNIAQSAHYPSYGGGVCVDPDGTFTKTGGTIYGYSAGDANSNVVKDSSGAVLSENGHAVFAVGGNNSNKVIKRRETTAGTGVNLAFDAKVYPPTYSGDWDD